LKSIINAIETEPKSITEIAEETGRDRKAISTYCQLLSETGLIKGRETGNEKLFWRYIISNRQTGLHLRGLAYNMQKMQKNLEATMSSLEVLIEKSADSERVLEAESK